MGLKAHALSGETSFCRRAFQARLAPRGVIQFYFLGELYGLKPVPFKAQNDHLYGG
jgi:hypothetical protein